MTFAAKAAVAPETTAFDAARLRLPNPFAGATLSDSDAATFSTQMSRHRREGFGLTYCSDGVLHAGT